ncbi:hypothetical protein HaLaN_14180, partial [Haematococcus lacustris]
MALSRDRPVPVSQAAASGHQANSLATQTTLTNPRGRQGLLGWGSESIDAPRAHGIYQSHRAAMPAST